VNASYGVNNFMITAKSCKKFVCEIRDDYAWCESGRGMNLPIDHVDYFVEVDTSQEKYQWMYIAEKDIKPNEVRCPSRNTVSKSCATATASRWASVHSHGRGHRLGDSHLRHLGVHSEMIGEYAFTLTEAGVVDNSRKPIDRGKCGWAYIMPVDTPRYYEWMHRNPYFAGCDIGYTNNVLTLPRLTIL